MNDAAAILPPGLYERLVTDELRDLLSAVPLAAREPLTKDDRSLLVGHVATALARELADTSLTVLDQITLCNSLLQELLRLRDHATTRAGERVAVPGETLLAIPLASAGSYVPPELERPEAGLGSDALYVNGPHEPRLSVELRRELASADTVDLICAFIVWSGVRIFKAEMEQLRRRGVRLRVITTTYTGITDPRALEELIEWGAEVRVSYDTGSTRLHAKAWLFRRDSGFSTAYVGSSNLTHTAIHDGLEWNVRLTEVHSPDLLTRFETAFETYWEDPHFVAYDSERFRRAVAREKTTGLIDFAPFDIVPYEYQREMLDALTAERERGHWRNLVVAATGTGKTIVAALDYKRLADSWKGAKLLFVAHRREILTQTRTILRHVLRDGTFGELLVVGEQPISGDHVFASVQSLARMDLAAIRPDAYDIVIIDEFHHAEAPTYRRLLDHFKPRLLVGLTATPERADGTDILHWFDDRIACELRLWDALAQGLLCPFQYFGVSDDVDLRNLEWRRGGYNLAQLDALYTGNDARTAKVLQAVRDIVADPYSMRCLGFCVSVEHAKYMAARFNAAGLAARAITGESQADDRIAALRELREGAITTIFSVDVYNEGVDIPEVDTILLLRPTESATVFIQQLGRGLRLSTGKSGLTVLDFIGQQRREFRFGPRFQAMAGLDGDRLVDAVQQGFPYLPSGCAIELDRVATQTVLENIRQAVHTRRDQLLQELRGLGDLSLSLFLSSTRRRLPALYTGGNPGWQRLRRDAGFAAPAAGPNEEALERAIGRMLHIDDPERVNTYRAWLAAESPPAARDVDERQRRLLTMLHFDVWGRQAAPTALDDSLKRLWQHVGVRQEVVDVLDVVFEQSHVPVVEEPGSSPLAVHARYTGEEVLAALGVSTAESPSLRREGVRQIPEARADVFFVTLRKSEARFSPTTMYRDYAISARQFHWESQSTTSVGSPTAERYIHHATNDWRILIFARETSDERAFVYLGPATYLRHSGDRPISFVWNLAYEMPPAFFLEARAAG